MTCLTYKEIAWGAVLYRAAASDELPNKGGKATLRYHDLVQRLRDLQLENIDTNTATDLIGFLNRWGRCRLTRHYSTKIKKAFTQLPFGVRDLSPLIEQTAEALEVVERSYSTLSTCGFGPTATSKILHLIHPPSFVMWDMKIRKHYKNRESSKGYAVFLDTMREMGTHAVKDFKIDHPCEDLAAFLCEKLKVPHQTELTKFLDEYNWIKWTRKATVPPDWHPCQV